MRGWSRPGKEDATSPPRTPRTLPPAATAPGAARAGAGPPSPRHPEPAPDPRLVVVAGDTCVRRAVQEALAGRGRRAALFSDPETAFHYLCGCFPRACALAVDEDIGPRAAASLLRRARLLGPGLRAALLCRDGPPSRPGADAELLRPQPVAAEALARWLVEAPGAGPEARRPGHRAARHAERRDGAGSA